MKAEVILFYSEVCPHCPAARESIRELSKKRDDFTLREVSILTPEGSREASLFHASSVPTFIIRGPGHDENIGLVGAQTEKVYNKYLDMALGKKPENEKIEEGKGLKIGKFRIRW